jgi:large subunit ribosomal protein L32e
MTLKKKGHPKFNIPDCGARNRSRVKPRWRKQRGIDNKKRIKKDFAGASPSIGYRNSDAVSGVRADGNRMMLVRNASELQMMIDKKALQGYAVTIAKGVSERKRMLMTQLAQKNGVKVTNGAYE